jgi:hypothetical protein
VRRAGLIIAAVVVPLALGGVAAASTIDQPRGNPVTAPVDGSGRLVPIAVVASGFAPGALVYVEQCDGAATSTPQWDPTLDCDFGSSPSAVTADANGVATFAANDRNHAFLPFVGESPQSQFNCLAAGTQPPRNNLPTFNRCAIRVSTNNTVRTADQSFVALVLPGNAHNPPPPTTVPPSRTTVPPGGSSTTTRPTRGTTPTTTAGGKSTTRTTSSTGPAGSASATTVGPSSGAGHAGGASTPSTGARSGHKNKSNNGVTIAIAIIIGVAAVAGGLALERVLAERRARRD